MKERIPLPTIEHCTGCQACRVACPTNAITMQENEKGNIYPIVDQELCINCNKCARICPELNHVKYHDKQDRVFAIWVNQPKKRRYSTSGGASFIMAKTIIERGGYFCGVVYNDDGAEHRICNNIEDLHSFQGSKYIHSNVKNVYKDVQTLLKDGNYVLFSGTACQIAALYKYLNKEYDKLYTIDILCHGVPSLRILREHIKEVEKRENKKISNIRFREKRPDQLHSCMKYTFNDNTNLIVPVEMDVYFRCFVENYALRPNCFSCQYANSNRIADITLADFWGYSPKKVKYLDCHKGVSLFLANTNKGKELLDMIRHECIIDKRDISEAQSCNRNLIQPQDKPKDYDIFWERYLKGETLSELSPSFFPTTNNQISSWKLTLKSFIKIILIKLHIKY